MVAQKQEGEHRRSNLKSLKTLFSKNNAFIRKMIHVNDLAEQLGGSEDEGREGRRKGEGS